MQIKLQIVLNILNNIWNATINKAIKIGPQKDVGRTAFHAASYGRRYVMLRNYG